MAQHQDTKGTVFIIVSVILILAVAGFVFFSIYQTNAENQRAGRAAACNMAYVVNSTDWQACMSRE